MRKAIVDVATLAPRQRHNEDRLARPCVEENQVSNTRPSSQRPPTRLLPLRQRTRCKGGAASGTGEYYTTRMDVPQRKHDKSDAEPWLRAGLGLGAGAHERERGRACTLLEGFGDGKERSLEALVGQCSQRGVVSMRRTGGEARALMDENLPRARSLFLRPRFLCARFPCLLFESFSREPCAFHA